MTYEEKVRWLRRYRDALRLEEELRQELEAQRARACKTTAALTGMPGGGGDGQALPRAVESIVAAQQELQAQINLCGATRREVVAGAGPGCRCAGPRDPAQAVSAGAAV